MHKLISTTLVFTMLPLSGCAQMNSSADPSPLTEKQAQILAKELDGKVAGKPINCLNSHRTDNLIRVSDDIILYRHSNNLVYKNKLRSSCPGLARDDDIMVTRSYSSNQCRGDIIELIDRYSGIPGGFCSLGEFVPYRKKEG